MEIITAPIVHNAQSYIAALSEEGIVGITDGESRHVGSGRWDGDRIVDCDARLGDTHEETKELYEALEAELIWMLSIWCPDGC